MHPPTDASSRFPWPPAIFGSACVIAVLLGWRAPLALVATEASRTALFIFGMALILLGGAIALAAEFGFYRAGTATLPIRPTTAIVSTGVYRFTRNPMYLGMSFLLAGCGPVLNSWWFLLALPGAVFAVTKLAIEREEIYLEEKFGAHYLAYKARVRRWL